MNYQQSEMHCTSESNTTSASGMSASVGTRGSSYFLNGCDISNLISSSKILRSPASLTMDLGSPRCASLYPDLNGLKLHADDLEKCWNTDTSKPDHKLNLKSSLDTILTTSSSSNSNSDKKDKDQHSYATDCVLEKRELPCHLKPKSSPYSSPEKTPVIDYSDYQEYTYQPEAPLAPEAAEDDQIYPLLQVSTTLKIPYIGTAQRTRALIKFSTRQQRTTQQVFCPSCGEYLVCMGGMQYVACVVCHSVSRLQGDHIPGEPKPRGVGIGLLFEEAEILRRNSHSCY
jgi:hypothetical protein